MTYKLALTRAERDAEALAQSLRSDLPGWEAAVTHARRMLNLALDETEHLEGTYASRQRQAAVLNREIDTRRRVLAILERDA